MLQKVEDDARVERAGASPHRQAVDRGETHRGGDALSPINGAHAGAVAEMGDDQLPFGAIGHHLGQ
jgi:hypothetical protein